MGLHKSAWKAGRERHNLYQFLVRVEAFPTRSQLLYGPSSVQMITPANSLLLYTSSLAISHKLFGAAASWTLIIILLFQSPDGY